MKKVVEVAKLEFQLIIDNLDITTLVFNEPDYTKK